MALSDALRQMRDDYLEGKDRCAGMYFHDEAVSRISGGDEALIGLMLEALDAATPGGNFHIWIDCGEAVMSGDQAGFVYADHQRKPSEVSAVLGKAILAARTKEAA